MKLLQSDNTYLYPDADNKSDWIPLFNAVYRVGNEATKLVMVEALENEKTELGLSSSDYNACLSTTDKTNKAGRPRIDPDLMKIQINIKMHPWLNNWLAGQDKSKIELIETALIETYNLEPPS